jgi:hypothetical protein
VKRIIIAVVAFIGLLAGTAAIGIVIGFTVSALYTPSSAPAAATSPAVTAATQRALNVVTTTAQQQSFPLTIPADLDLAPLCDRWKWALDYGFDTRVAYHLTVSEAVVRLQARDGEAQRAIARALIVDLYSDGGLCMVTP